YERGPIRFVWDGHTNADLPTKCDMTNQTGPTSPHILNVFVINDAEIADYLKTQYGMPAIYADIQSTAQAAGALTQRTWSWAPPGQARSEINVLDDSTTQPYSLQDRFWWPRGDGLAQLDIAYTRVGQMVTDRPAYGTMHPPMLLPPPEGNFVGTARYFPSLAGEGKITFFSDRLCEHPVST
ncbi:MAG: hypothetical protein ABR586_06575, partial [Thermoplasmatota archaeon]